MDKMREWEVWSKHLKGHSATEPSPHIDVVYFEENITGEEVRKSLIRHDGYPENIEVYDVDREESVRYKGYRRMQKVNKTDIEGGDLGMNLAAKVQEFHNGYIITVREFLDGTFEYNIANSNGGVCTMPGFKNVKEAITDAKEFIDKIGPCPIYVKRVKELIGQDT